MEFWPGSMSWIVYIIITIVKQDWESYITTQIWSLVRFPHVMVFIYFFAIYIFKGYWWEN